MNHKNEHRCIRWWLTLDIILHKKNDLAVWLLLDNGKPGAKALEGDNFKQEKYHG